MEAGKLIFTPQTGEMVLQRQMESTKTLFNDVLRIYIADSGITIAIYKDKLVINGGDIKGAFIAHLNIMHGKEGKMLYCLNFFKATQELSERLPCPSFVWSTSGCILRVKDDVKNNEVREFFGLEPFVEYEFSLDI